MESFVWFIHLAYVFKVHHIIACVSALFIFRVKTIPLYDNEVKKKKKGQKLAEDLPDGGPQPLWFVVMEGCFPGPS